MQSNWSGWIVSSGYTRWYTGVPNEVASRVSNRVLNRKCGSERESIIPDCPERLAAVQSKAHNRLRSSDELKNNGAFNKQHVANEIKVTVGHREAGSRRGRIFRKHIRGAYSESIFKEAYSNIQRICPTQLMVWLLGDSCRYAPTTVFYIECYSDGTARIFCRTPLLDLVQAPPTQFLLFKRAFLDQARSPSRFTHGIC